MIHTPSCADTRTANQFSQLNGTYYTIVHRRHEQYSAGQYGGCTTYVSVARPKLWFGILLLLLYFMWAWSVRPSAGSHAFILNATTATAGGYHVWPSTGTVLQNKRSKIEENHLFVHWYCRPNKICKWIIYLFQKLIGGVLCIHVYLKTKINVAKIL